MNRRRIKNRLRHPLLFSRIVALLWIIFAPLQLQATTLSESSLSEQRILFQNARDALDNGRQKLYQKLAQQLHGYPLYPYLEYWEITSNLSNADTAKVERFLTQYADTPLAGRLRLGWLERLAKQEQWPQFLTFYTPGNGSELECYYRRALYKTGDKEGAFKDMEKLWLTAEALSRVCDPLISAWRESEILNEDLVWKRVAIIMQQGDVYEARALEPYLNKTQRTQAELWRDVYHHPEKILADKRLKENTPINRTILAHGVRRLARMNPLMAAESWNTLIMEYSFSEEEYDRTETEIALALARAKAPEALKWLTHLADQNNPAVREWRVLAAINQGNWEEALLGINQLTAEEQSSERWLYWRARAYEAIGKPERARPFFEEAAKNRDYYGFLAADHIGIPYEFENRPLQFSASEMEATRALPTVQRALEFYALGDINNARREWFHLTQRADKNTLLKAALVAHEWGWHDRAIFTLGRAEYLDDLEIRFPLAHREQVVNNANLQQIDPSWAYAIIRQESSFASDARSPKGAMGLMQIMPTTGKVIAKDLSTRLRESSQLLDINTNIRFGISYLRKILNRFDQNTALATAAYNAGSQRVKGWLPKEEGITPDLWVENIPFKETRHYVKQVLAYATIYDNRMTRPATPITQRMTLVPTTPNAPPL